MVALRACAIFGRLGDEDLALGHGGGAGGLQLGHFFLAHDAHAAGGLQAQAGVITEGRNLDARLAAGVNQQRPRGSGELLSIDDEGYVWHVFLRRRWRGALQRAFEWEAIQRGS
jgi:hypothetical protein